MINKNNSLIERDKIIGYRNETNFVVIQLEKQGDIFP